MLSTVDFENAVIGPGGYVTGVVFAGPDATPFVRTDIGGAYRLGPNDTWQPLLDRLRYADNNFMSVESIASHNSDVYFMTGNLAGTGDFGRLYILRDGQDTVDAGTWSTGTPAVLGNGGARDYGERMVVVNDNLIYYGTRRSGLYRGDRSPTTGHFSWNRVLGSTIGTGYTGIVDGRTFYYGLNSLAYDRTRNVLYVAESGKTIWRIPNASSATPPTSAIDLGTELASGSGRAFQFARSLAVSSTGTLWAASSQDHGFDQGLFVGKIAYSLTERRWTQAKPFGGTTDYKFTAVAVDPDPGQNNRVIATAIRDTGPRGTKGSWTWVNNNFGDGPWVELNPTPVVNVQWYDTFRDYNPSVCALAFRPGFDQVYQPGWYGMFRYENLFNPFNTPGDDIWALLDRGMEENVVTSIASTLDPAATEVFVGVRDNRGFELIDPTYTSEPDKLSSTPAGVNGAPNPQSNTLDIDINEHQSDDDIYLRVDGAAELGSDPSGYLYSRTRTGEWTYRPTFDPEGNRFYPRRVAVSGGGDRAWLIVASDGKAYFTADAGESYSVARFGTGELTGLLTGATGGSAKWIAAERDRQRFYVYNNNQLLVGTPSPTTGTITFINGGTTGNLNADPRRAMVTTSFGRANTLWISPGSTNAGLWRSTNGGLTVEPVTFFNGSNVRSVTTGVGLGNGWPAVYVLAQRTSSDRGLYLSTDGGSTWTHVSDPDNGISNTNAMVAGKRTFGSIFVGTGGRGVFVGRLDLPDTAPPTLLDASFNFSTGPQSLVVNFSEDVGASLVSGTPFTLINLTTSQTVMVNVSVSPTGQTATLTFPDTANELGSSTLLDGNYRLTLSGSAIRDASGNPLGSDASFDFFFVNADFSRNGSVGFEDLLTLAQNFGTLNGGTFLTGDTDYDGNVDFDDLLSLAQRFGIGLLVEHSAGRSFRRLAAISVLPEANPVPRDVIDDPTRYGPHPMNLEKRFSRDTVDQRRATRADESAFVSDYWYANAPGYAVVHVDPDHVDADIHLGVNPTP
jgi:xyloglucan-specific exo-beta-1,4-glucanase